MILYTFLIILFIIILYLQYYKNNEHFVSNHNLINNQTTYIPYWEIKKIRDYEECAWREIPNNKKTVMISINNYFIKDVIKKVLNYYQKDDFIKQYQYRVFLPNNNNKIPLTIYDNNIHYEIKLNIYRLYVYSDKNIYNQNIVLDTTKLKNTQGFEVNVLFTKNKNSIQIVKVDYLRSIQNQNYFYNLE